MAKIAVTGLIAIDTLAVLSGESFAVGASSALIGFVFHQFTLMMCDVSERLASLSQSHAARAAAVHVEHVHAALGPYLAVSRRALLRDERCCAPTASARADASPHTRRRACASTATSISRARRARSTGASPCESRASRTPSSAATARAGTSGDGRSAPPALA